MMLLSIIDAGTSFNGCCLLKNRKLKHVVRSFFGTWTQHYGVPHTVLVDQGREFVGLFNDICEGNGNDVGASGV